jgi:hypothetical protein
VLRPSNGSQQSQQQQQQQQAMTMNARVKSRQ